MRRLGYAAAIMMMTAATPSMAQEPVRLHAAGSLRGALTEVIKGFEAESGLKVEAKYGPSGILRKEIGNGAKAGIFASANMEHPAALSKEGKSGPVSMFARNRLCALVKPGLAVTPTTLLDKMLDPTIKVGTSTPKADPAGDYAFDSFGRSEKVKPGSAETLKKKALQLTGGPDSPPPKDRSVYGAVIAEGKADIFLTYCTNAVVAKRENPGQEIVALPEELAVGADYGLTVMKDASPNDWKLADYILSSKGQSVLASHGFAPPN